jgi:hypothetical protein
MIYRIWAVSIELRLPTAVSLNKAGSRESSPAFIKKLQVRVRVRVRNPHSKMTHEETRTPLRFQD